MQICHPTRNDFIQIFHLSSPIMEMEFFFEKHNKRRKKVVEFHESQIFLLFCVVSGWIVDNKDNFNGNQCIRSLSRAQDENDSPNKWDWNFSFSAGWFKMRTDVFIFAAFFRRFCWHAKFPEKGEQKKLKSLSPNMRATVVWVCVCVAPKQFSLKLRS